MTKKLAFQGEPGAFSHAAVHALFPHDEALPCVTFEDTIAAVQSGAADRGVVPVENSLYGRITDIYHLLPESGLHIIGEHFLRVEMNLLAVPGATMARTSRIRTSGAGSVVMTLPVGWRPAPRRGIRPAWR